MAARFSGTAPSPMNAQAVPSAAPATTRGDHAKTNRSFVPCAAHRLGESLFFSTLCIKWSSPSFGSTDPLELRTYLLAIRRRKRPDRLPETLAQGLSRLAIRQRSSGPQGSHHRLDYVSHGQWPIVPSAGIQARRNPDNRRCGGG